MRNLPCSKQREHLVDRPRDLNRREGASREQFWEDVLLSIQDTRRASPGVHDAGLAELSRLALQLDPENRPMQEPNVGQTSLQPDPAVSRLLLR
jgi:hypothetical protein